jgi:hypothetical protein
MLAWYLTGHAPQVMSYLHERGVKGFVALNVLVFDEELPAVEQQLHHIASCGADAIIVQARMLLCVHAVHKPLVLVSNPGWPCLEVCAEAALLRALKAQEEGI